MAGRGPAPKDPATTRRPNGRQRKPIAADGGLRGPELPELPTRLDENGEPIGWAWPDRTRSWWASWRRSPQATLFTDTDWDFLADTALLHARFWSGDASVAAELRLRVAKLGATKEDRDRLKIEAAPPDAGEQSAVRAAMKPEDRRHRLRVV